MHCEFGDIVLALVPLQRQDSRVDVHVHQLGALGGGGIACGAHGLRGGGAVRGAEGELGGRVDPHEI
jgi:hypothetical protein